MTVETKRVARKVGLMIKVISNIKLDGKKVQHQTALKIIDTKNYTTSIQPGGLRNNDLASLRNHSFVYLYRSKL